MFADPDFDGDPAFATQEEIDEHGKIKETEVITPEEPEIEGGVTGEDTTVDSGPAVIVIGFPAVGGNTTSTADRSQSTPTLFTNWIPAANNCE